MKISCDWCGNNVPRKGLICGIYAYQKDRVDHKICQGRIFCASECHSKWNGAKIRKQQETKG